MTQTRTTLEEDIKVFSAILFVAGAVILFLGLIATLSHGYRLAAVIVCGATLFLWMVAYGLLALVGLRR